MSESEKEEAEIEVLGGSETAHRPICWCFSWLLVAQLRRLMVIRGGKLAFLCGQRVIADFARGH